METKAQNGKPLLFRPSADERAALEAAAAEADRAINRELRRIVRSYYGLDRKRKPAMTTSSR